MTSSIQKRLFRSFTLVIIFSVILFEIIVIIGISRVSYRNMERIMADNIDYAINSIVFRSESLDILEILDPSFRQYFNNNNAQVQLINREGEVIFDSLGVYYSDEIIYPDITLAQNGEKGVWRGRVDYSDEKVMAMSTPILNSTNQNIGILRMVIGLSSLEALIIRGAGIAILVGIIIVLISLLISNYFAKGLVEPLKYLSDVAVKIANGQFNVRSSVKTNDEIEQVSNSMNYMAEELIKRDELKNDFISSVSHELRTPLTSIKGWAITIQNGENLDKKIVNEGLNIIANEADRLSDMVEELLDFSRYTSGKVTLNKEEINVEEFLDDIIKQMKPRVLEQGLILFVDLSENLNFLTADSARLKQVFINVLDNAVKFTEPPGMISIFAKRNSSNEYVFGIRDTGFGIPPEQLSKVKEKFFKGNLGKSHTGLGLSISDEIVNLHGGELIIESEQNVGTTVTIVLPSELGGKD